MRNPDCVTTGTDDAGAGEKLPRAGASDDPGDKVVGILKRVEDTLFVPVFSVLLSSPLWGFPLAWWLGWPFWLGLLVSTVPSLSLFLAGVMNIILRKWTNLKRAKASSFEPLLILLALVTGVALPLIGYYAA